MNIVMAGLDPANPAYEGTAVPCDRDRRVKPGDDGLGGLIRHWVLIHINEPGLLCVHHVVAYRP